MNIDIGSGNCKHPGFFGIDRKPSSETDLVWNLNDPLPLPDDSVEFVMASRCLPYVNDLFAVMKELHRVCVHKAVVCVLAPYAHSFVHMSNPLFKQKFDEHTPRYLTPHFFQPSHGPLCPVNAQYPEEPPAFDFRLLRMELFYDPAYAPPLYEREELEVLRRVQPNVVREIMYHFVAVKEPVGFEELERMSRQRYPEPAAVVGLRKALAD
ncbi:hypothetical protein ACFFNY_23880 [Paenibacillus hodogayensis]|uniref:Methyltransferase type 11 domain-containing protein n=1 Tax=Paenibacillus hodogayensis TaxID=279208 RepID=A0ABV5W217_9BACL